MKLTLILFLVFASVAVLRADEANEEEQDEPSLTQVYDGTLEDEVLGNEEDPADHKKKLAMLKTMKPMVICGRVAKKCLKKVRWNCKLIKVCKVSYFACRCILKGVAKCKRFLGWVKMMAKKDGRKNDEADESEDPSMMRMRFKWKKLARKCKRGYKRCRRNRIAKRKNCKPCLKRAKTCIKQSIRKYYCSKAKGDEPMDDEEDDDQAVANIVEHEDAEEDDNDVEEDESEDARMKGNVKLALKRCSKRGMRCMLRAKLNCKRQERCGRRFKRCFRRAMRRLKRGRY